MYRGSNRPAGQERKGSRDRLIGVGMFIAFWVVVGLCTSGPPTSAASTNYLVPNATLPYFTTKAGPNPQYNNRYGISGQAKPRMVGVANGSFKVESLWVQDEYNNNNVEVGWWRQQLLNDPFYSFGTDPYFFASWKINGAYGEWPDPNDPYHLLVLASPIDQFHEFRVEYHDDIKWYWYFKGEFKYNKALNPIFAKGYPGGQGERHDHADQCMTRWQVLRERVFIPNPPTYQWLSWPAIQQLYPDSDGDCKLCTQSATDFIVRWNSASCP